MQSQHPAKGPFVSVVTAAYNERDNLPELYRRIAAVFSDEVEAWELIIVDDHSSDDTFGVVRDLAETDPRVRGIRLSRNCGSHIAKLAGFQLARGDLAIGLAADLQDPPETIPALLEAWRSDNQIVWAVRTSRPGESISTRLFSSLYRFLVGTLLGVKELTKETSSLLLLDARVLRALERFDEQDPHYLGLIRSLGFRSAEVGYVQQARLHGESGWSLGRKLQLVRRSILAFSPAPIRIIGRTGWMLALGSAAAGAAAWCNVMPLALWPAAVFAIGIVGGLQLAALGWIGEYVWRTLEEVRRRPRHLVEASVNASEAADE